MKRWVRGLIVGSLLGAATGGAMVARGRMMNNRTMRGRAKRTMSAVRRRAMRVGDAARAGAWAFTRRLLD